MGDGLIYHDSIFTPETGERVVNHKSATTVGNLKTAYFSPESRLKLAVNFEKHIQSLPLSGCRKKILIRNMFSNQLYLATFGYKNIMGNHKICSHYRMERRHVTKTDLLKIGYLFYLRFVERVSTGDSLAIFGNLLLMPDKVFSFIARVLLK